MPRDSQRQRLYDAEYVAFSRSSQSPAGLTLREAQKFINRIVSRGLYQKLGGPRGVIVKANPRRRTYSAMVGPYSIELADGWGYNKDVVIHEMTHILQYHRFAGVAAHGPEYVLVYRRLIEQELGVDVRQKLDLALEKRHVKWGTNGNKSLQRNLGNL